MGFDWALRPRKGSAHRAAAPSHAVHRAGPREEVSSAWAHSTVERCDRPSAASQSLRHALGDIEALAVPLGFVLDSLIALCLLTSNTFLRAFDASIDKALDRQLRPLGKLVDPNYVVALEAGRPPLGIAGLTHQIANDAMEGLAPARVVVPVDRDSEGVRLPRRLDLRPLPDNLPCHSDESKAGPT